MSARKLKIIGGLYIAYKLINGAAHFIFPFIMIGVGLYLMIDPPEEFEENLEMSKTTLMAIVILLIGMGGMKQRKR